MISVSDEMAKEVEDYRYLNRIPSESEAFRQLLELGLLEARKKTEPKVSDHQKDAPIKKRK